MKSYLTLFFLFVSAPMVLACPLVIPSTVLPPQPQFRPAPVPFVPAPVTPAPVTPAPRTSAKTGASVDVYPVQPGAGGVPTGSTRNVGFWNYSGRTVVLVVGTQRLTLAPRQSTQLALATTFTWNEVGQVERAEVIPATAAGLEVVLRQ